MNFCVAKMGKREVQARKISRTLFMVIKCVIKIVIYFKGLKISGVKLQIKNNYLQFDPRKPRS